MSRVIAATIRGGVAVSDEFADLPDGTAVTVVAPDEGTALTPEQISDLEEANAEADRGELLPAEDVLRMLDERRERRAASTAR